METIAHPACAEFFGEAFQVEGAELVCRQSHRLGLNGHVSDGLAQVVVREVGVGQLCLIHVPARQRDHEQAGVRRPPGRAGCEVTYQRS